MPDIKRTVKVVTEQQIIDKPSVMEGFPMRKWSIKIFLLDEHGDETTANIFSSAEYLLHESFGERARQVKTDPPFRISEEGWGEFEMRIILHTIDGGKEHSFVHDLNFGEPRYDTKHVVAFKKATPAQIAALRMSGPVPGEEPPRKKAAGDETPLSGAGAPPAKKRKSGIGGSKDKLENLERLAEEIKQIKDKDMYELIEIINDNKGDESQITNDLENGEFTVDLCTLPEKAIELLQRYVEETLAR